MHLCAILSKTFDPHPTLAVISNLQFYNLQFVIGFEFNIDIQ